MLATVGASLKNAPWAFPPPKASARLDFSSSVRRVALVPVRRGGAGRLARGKHLHHTNCAAVSGDAISHSLRAASWCARRSPAHALDRFRWVTVTCVDSSPSPRRRCWRNISPARNWDFDSCSSVCRPLLGHPAHLPRRRRQWPSSFAARHCSAGNAAASLPAPPSGDLGPGRARAHTERDGACGIRATGCRRFMCGAARSAWRRTQPRE